MKGSASVVTDANGNKLDDCDFLPFGQTLCQTSSSGNHYLYTGLERDADQLDHTLHRQYSSSLGRWMSPDPGGVKVVHLNNPQTWNLYAYVTDNPTTFNDPTGLVAAADGDGCSSAVQTNTTQTCGTVQWSSLSSSQQALVAGGKKAWNGLNGTQQANFAAITHALGTIKLANGATGLSEVQSANMGKGKDAKVMTVVWKAGAESAFKRAGFHKVWLDPFHSGTSFRQRGLWTGLHLVFPNGHSHESQVHIDYRSGAAHFHGPNDNVLLNEEKYKEMYGTLPGLTP